MTQRITVDIVSDAICPWCFIGKRRFERALADAPAGLEVAIAWRPFQLNPDMPPEGADRQSYLAAKFGGEARAEKIYQNVTDVGRGAGIAFNFGGIPRTPNTINAHRLIAHAGAAGKQDAVVERLFQAYFTEGKDIGDTATLARIAAAAGMDEAETRAYLDSDADVERIENEDAMARRMGIQGVPCFIFNGKYAVSGAQEPAVFKEVFATLMREAAEGAPAPAA